MNRQLPDPSITLALGGGGARGVAHLGVIEVLLETGLQLERLVGISIGSLVGAMFAFHQDIAEVQARSLSYLLSERFQRHQRTLFGTISSEEADAGGLFSWYDRIKDYLRANQLFHRVVTQKSLLPSVILQDVVDNLLPDADIADAAIPLSIVAVDLRSGHRVVLEKGSVRQAVRASSSLPGIFPPVEFEGMQLCDVGVFCSLPTTVGVSYGTGTLLAVDVSSDLQPLNDCETALDVLMRMDEIGESLFRKHVRNSADLVIRPKVSQVEWFDFSSAPQLIDAGRVAARNAMAELGSRQCT
ncbi:MAG: patatin-like phospholipase family protein [Planctomycetaceae bacterium]